jgi:hypothetical protein
MNECSNNVDSINTPSLPAGRQVGGLGVNKNHIETKSPFYGVGGDYYVISICN